MKVSKAIEKLLGEVLHVEGAELLLGPNHPAQIGIPAMR